MNIISLLPATTEIICSLGLGEHLVGRSHECDYPEFVTNLPVCTEPKNPFEGTSYNIDQKIKAILAEGLSIYRIHPEKITELNPDFILTQDQCEVCAVHLKDVEQCLSQLGVDTSIISFSPETLDEIFTDIQTMAHTLNVSERGKQLKYDIEHQFSAIRNKTHQAEAVHIEVIEWIDPLMSAGNWMPELIEIAGGYCSLAKEGEHSPFIDFEKIQEADPDILAIIPCGYSIEQTQSELETLYNLAGWNNLKAVQNNKVYVADGHQYFNRPGPRIAESAHILAEIINPKTFQPTLKNKAWIQL